MQKTKPITVLTEKEKEVLNILPNTISKTFKKHLETLMDSFSAPSELNARIKRIFSKQP